jgi:hypothetical protein
MRHNLNSSLILSADAATQRFGVYAFQDPPLCSSTSMHSLFEFLLLYTVEVGKAFHNRKTFYIFFDGLVCVGHSFAYVYAAHFVCSRNVWIRTQRAAVASRFANNLATNLPRLATHLTRLATHLTQLTTHLPP